MKPPPTQARGVLWVPWSSPQARGGGPSRSRNVAGDSTGDEAVLRLVRSLSPDTAEVTLQLLEQMGADHQRLGARRHRSPERSFDAAPDEVASFRCQGPRVWPQYVAALFKSDLSITLRPE